MQNFTLHQALNFWHVRTLLSPSLHQDAVVVPSRARVMAALVTLDDLAVSHGLVGTVCGFDHALLDATQEGWNARDFPYPVGMYRHRLLSAPACILPLALAAPASSLECVSSIAVTAAGPCHAVMTWLDYDLDERHSVSGAPVPAPDGNKQLLRFFSAPVAVAPGDVLQASAAYSKDAGSTSFEFAWLHS
jgi:hypothetical protein